MSSPSVQVQPQPSGAKGVSHTTKEAGAMNFDIVRCSRCQRSMSLENESSPGVSRNGTRKRNDIVTNAFFVVPSSSLLLPHHRL
ncbi:hypothetical protein BDV32DRAFT_144097 [Aspergillus pseudonomiae]|nr:hypothetical protein BDV32DRAFT_144097 [Aspergillus pseudonomiae]